ncbi:PD-(D/E)XK nuclease family protein [Porticoccaceae bacterium]|nr:PD-(D/E)XK nuclease family protein [Porticoccaceae bacterium]
MLPSLINIDKFEQTINANGLILTANSRQANAIMSALASKKEEDTSWLAPMIYSMDQWIQRTWEDLQRTAHPDALVSVVGTFQNTYFWNRAINEHEEEVQSRYVTLAANTLKLLDNQQVTLADVTYPTPATEKFSEWAMEYKKLLIRNNLVTKEDCITILIKAFNEGTLERYKDVQVFGWQTIPPLHKALLQSAAKNTVRVTQDAVSTPHQTWLARADNEKDELRSATLWAAKTAKDNPKSRVAIVVPSLEEKLPVIERLVAEAMGEIKLETSVNFSAGTPLTHTPIICAALNLIELVGANKAKSMEDVIELIGNPFSGLAHLSINEHARLEKRLRKTREFECPLSLLVEHLPEDENKNKSGCISGFEKVLTQQSHLVGVQQGFSDWCNTFVDILNLFHWGPGALSLSSEEYQQVTSWTAALVEFCRLDNLNITIGFKKAFRHLKEILSKTIYHPETVDGQIQVLGLLEAVGLNFEFAWVCSMDSKNFPAHTSVNELLPAKFQRDNEFPFSRPELELKIAWKMLNTLKSSVENTAVFSYASTHKDEQVMPSPLLTEIEEVSCAQLTDCSNENPSWFTQPNLCEVIVDRGCEFNPEIEKISTGAALLKNQSACPFNAFAIHRLKAEPLEESAIGLSNIDRGNLLHEVMESLLVSINSSTKLKSYTEGELRHITSTCIAKIIKRWRDKHPAFSGPAFREVEQHRLEKLVGEWLEIEKNRGEWVVSELETRSTVTLGGLDLSMRVDRKDLVAGNELVIDYKSGEVHPSHWNGARPKDPQLPLYVVAGEPKVNGCAFAQIKGGDLRFVGLSETQNINHKENPVSWGEQVDGWKASLTALAVEFKSGTVSTEIFNQTLFRHQNFLLPLNRNAESDVLKIQGATHDQR